MTRAQTATAYDKLRRDFEVQHNAQNSAALGKLFTEDAELMPPDGPVLTGRDAIAGHYQGWFDRFATKLTITVDESMDVGDLALGRGTYQLTLTPRTGGDAITINGKWMNLSQPQSDGSVQICRHIWNAPTPPQS